MNKQKPANPKQSSAPNSTKGNRKFAPAFFSRKKNKKQETHIEHGVETRDMDSDEEDTEIARFEDFDHGSIDPVYLGQLDDSQLNSVEEQEAQYDKIYQRRVDYILSHYERPPPYPGTNKERKVKQTGQIISPSQLDQNTPLLKQLLKENQLNDNSSMVNFMQAPPHYHRNSNVNPRNFQGDNLVLRTQNYPVQKSETSRELYEKRKQHYMARINEIEHIHTPMTNHQARDRDAISEIIYPAKNYDFHQLQRPINKMQMSASVPDLSMNNTKNFDNDSFSTTARKPRGKSFNFLV